MSGTIEGGKKASAMNMAREAGFYTRIGRMGGLNGVGDEYKLGGSKASGFAANPKLASKVGVVGGRKSRRHKMTDEDRAFEATL